MKRIEVEDNGKTIRQSYDFSSALSINFVTRSQSDTYTCRVQNNAATATYSAQLKVNGTYFSYHLTFNLILLIDLNYICMNLNIQF